MKKKKLKTILIDLDGVLNKYNGKYDENFIPEIREGAEKIYQRTLWTLCYQNFHYQKQNSYRKMAYEIPAW